MTKQKSNLLQRTIMILLSIVLTMGTVCNTVPANVFAQENIELQENIISSDQEWGAQTLAAGIYTINSGVTVTITGQVTVSGDVTIKGGGKLVRGDSNACFFVSGSSLTLQNIEIDGASLVSGNAMAEVTNNGMVTLSDGCWIHHCYKNTSRGAVFELQQSSAVFEDAIIENCQATSYGGAIYMTAGSSLIINDGTYQKNSTSSTTSSYGGGFIYNRESKLEIYGGRFIDNTSYGRGGCIYNAGLGGTETYLYDGYFQGNKSFYDSSDGKGSGAIFYSSENTAATIIQFSGNVQFCGDDTAGSGIDGIFLGLASNAERKAQISSELKYPIMLYLKAEEGRVIAQGVGGYKLQKKDMKKIVFTDVYASGSIWYAKLDEENNQVILTKINPGYQLYVTYVSNGAEGNVLDEKGYNNGDTVTVQSENGLSHQDGYNFDGWNTKPDGTGTTYQAGSTFKISEDVTLYAQWTDETKVIYDYATNGGNSATQTSVAVQSGEEIDLTPTAIKTGWEFVGWNTDPDAEEGLVSLKMGDEKVVLYAIYKKDLTLTFYSGKVGEKETQETTLYNKQEDLTFTFPKLKDLDVSEVNGYTAYGWSDDKDSVSAISEENTSGQAAEDMTFYGAYQKGIKISYDANNGSGNVPESQIMTNYAVVSDAECEFYTKDSEIIKLEDGTGLSLIGYTFNGWIEGSETGNVIPAGTSVNPTKDTVYYASWVLAAYKVTLHTNGGDNGTNLDSYTYGIGAALPLDWMKKGYIFDGWFDNESLTGTAVTDISNKDTGDKEYWAKWIDNIPPVLGTLSYSYDPKNLWQWLIGKESLIITVPVTEEGSGADQITYKITPENGSTSMNAAEIKNGAAKIIIDADFKGTISITCTDKAGNISADKTASAEYNGFIIEDNAPQIDFQTDSTSVQGEYMSAPAITVSVTDDKDNAVSAGISSVTYKIGNNAETAIQQDFTTSMKTSVSFMIPADKIPAGETVIIVTATDNAGNQNTVTKTIKVHIHSGTLIPATAADCTTSGNMAYYTCSCGKWFSDSECTAEITNDADIIIKALGHDFSVIQCDETGHWKKCSRCEEKQPIEAHIEDEGIVTKEATATDTGIKTYKCTVCGYVMRTETIPATGSGEEKPVSGNIIVAAPVISDGAPDGDFVDTLDEVKKAVILTQEERTEIANGIDVNIWLDIKPVTPTENKKTLIEAKKGDYTIGTYMDISMFKQVGDKTPNFVSQLNKKIKISIVIPEELRNTDNSVERIYRVLHYHDTEAEAEVLTGTYDEKTFTYIFETDRFSTYAIAYKDSKESTVSNENNNSSTPTDTIKEDIIKEDTIKEDTIPKTNDSEIPEIWLWVLVLSGIGVIYFSKMAADNTVKKK